MARTQNQAIRDENKKRADLVKAIIKRYLGNGIWLYSRLGCNQTGFAAAGQGEISYAPGTSVNLAGIQGNSQQVVATLPPPGRRGASSAPVATLGGAVLDALALRRAVPWAIPQGVTGLAVALDGGGFSESPVDLVTAVLFDPVTQLYSLDPFITVTSVIYVSSVLLSITLDCDSSAPVDYRPDFKVTRA